MYETKYLVKIQRNRLVEEMLKLSKADTLLLNFSYNGKMQDYLLQLPFHEAKMIFLIRSRMFPTKANFPGRWSTSNLCPFCCEVENDEHLFRCCGYMDLHSGSLQYRKIATLQYEMDELRDIAKILLKIHDRLILMNEDNSINKGVVAE